LRDASSWLAFAGDLARTGRTCEVRRRVAGALQAWKTIPSWAVVGTLDKVLPRAEQEAMARRAKARITSVRAGHLSMLSQPKAVAGVIERAAKRAG
jgi:pimeloyl-ACP methyl ester carboxylesterase